MMCAILPSTYCYIFQFTAAVSPGPNVNHLPRQLELCILYAKCFTTYHIEAKFSTTTEFVAEAD